MHEYHKIGPYASLHRQETHCLAGVHVIELKHLSRV